MPMYYISRVIRGVEERYPPPSLGETRIHPNYGRLQAKVVLPSSHYSSPNSQIHEKRDEQFRDHYTIGSMGN